MIPWRFLEKKSTCKVSEVTNKNQQPWLLSEEELYKEYKTSIKGLSEAEAALRYEANKAKLITTSSKRTALQFFLSQFKNALVLILIGAALTSFFLGERTDSLVILLIVVINAIFGFIQEYRTDKTLQALRKYIKIKIKTLRSGQVVATDMDAIVPGDVVYFTIGEVVPADVRLIQCHALSTNESALTGESIPVNKNTEALKEAETVPAKINNMAFMGTTIAGGTGYGIVTAIGKDTFFGQTAEYLKKDKAEGNYQKSIKKFSNFLLKVILLMTVLVFIFNAVLDKGLFVSFLFALALAVGVTPEALPIIMTITLSKGASRMAKKEVLSRNIAAIENLGTMNVLCCDKTGTLTQGEPELNDYANDKGEKDIKIIQYAILCNTSKESLMQNPLDSSITKYIVDNKIAELPDKLIGSNEFDFERRRMSVLVSSPDGNKMICKGAPEAIIPICSVLEGGAMTEEAKAGLFAKIREYEMQGYKIIAVADKSTTQFTIKTEDENNFNFTGFLLFMDPVKDTAKDSLSRLGSLGVEIKVISGDSPYVTERICKELDLAIKEGKVVLGEELAKLDAATLNSYALKYNVFARVTPEQKYNIVKALNNDTNVVGFLGDGINDAPALKAADVGISVDTASNIAKEAADIILLKKSLGVLADGIVEGRKAFRNMTKYILNSVSSNFGNMFTVAISSLFLPFLPLLPIQILLNNFISDFPMVMISTDNVDDQSITKPQHWDFKLITKFMLIFGLLSDVFDLFFMVVLLHIYKVSPEEFRSEWFVYSVASELLVMFAIRSRLSIFKTRPSNALVGATVLVVVITCILPFTAIGQHLFKFTPIPLSAVALMFFTPFAYLAAVEVAKHFFYRQEVFVKNY